MNQFRNSELAFYEIYFYLFVRLLLVVMMMRIIIISEVSDNINNSIDSDDNELMIITALVK